jgi:ribosomal protein S18 acetylase RimI-like enzyme
MVRTYMAGDEAAVVDLWECCNLTVPSNNPHNDIDRKMANSPHLFFVAELDDDLVATCMAGYDGHRGWIYYLAVRSDFRRKGIATRMIKHSEKALAALGCPKIDLMVRETNKEVLGFYRSIGYSGEPVSVLSKRLTEDPPCEEHA